MSSDQNNQGRLHSLEVHPWWRRLTPTDLPRLIPSYSPGLAEKPPQEDGASTHPRND